MAVTLWKSSPQHNIEGHQMPGSFRFLCGHTQLPELSKPRSCGQICLHALAVLYPQAFTCAREGSGRDQVLRPGHRLPRWRPDFPREQILECVLTLWERKFFPSWFPNTYTEAEKSLDEVNKGDSAPAFSADTGEKAREKNRPHDERREKHWRRNF